MTTGIYFVVRSWAQSRVARRGRTPPIAASGAHRLALYLFASAMVLSIYPSSSNAAPLTDPNDSRTWQGASVETFRSLLGFATRQDLIDAQILDDGIFATPIDLAAFTASSTPCSGDTISAPTATYIGNVEGCSGYSYNPSNYAYYCTTESPYTFSTRGNCLDMNWLQDTGNNNVSSGNIWDLGGPANQVVVFPIVDHDPLPGEAMEYSVYLSNNPNTTTTGTDGNSQWVLAALDKVYLEGWHQGWVADGFTTVWRLPNQQTFRYVNVVAGGPGALIQDGDDEIDAVMGLTFEGDPVIECGNNLVEPGEECDDAADNSDTQPDACRTDCTAPACGDGVVDTGEECDDGNISNVSAPSECRANCTIAACGDGIVDSEEECDDGADNSNTEPDACRTYCTAPACGDGVVDTGEECDKGWRNSASGSCSLECTAAVPVSPGNGITPGSKREGCSTTSTPASSSGLLLLLGVFLALSRRRKR